MKPLIFFGSSSFSIPVLQVLVDNQIEIIAVVTTSDKPVGRHLKLTPNPVKMFAQNHNVPVIEKLSEIINQESLFLNHPVGLVAAYGRILKPEILNMFNTHLYNIHPSLLPKYRGASPLQNQLLDGGENTGVTIIRMDYLMDHGPIVAVRTDRISDTDTVQTLGVRLFTQGAELFLSDVFKHSDIPVIPQDETQATYTKILTRQDGFVVWENFLQFSRLENKFRAFSPWPGVWSISPAGRRVKLISLKPQILVQYEGKNPELFTA